MALLPGSIFTLQVGNYPTCAAKCYWTKTQCYIDNIVIFRMFAAKC